MNQNQLKIENIKALKEALAKTLEQLSNRKIESSQAKLISSWNANYDYGGINIFETSFVDALVSNLAAIQGIGNIGWEVNYPSDVKGEPWYRNKLDLAIGHIEHETRLNTNWEPQALFQMPIEVKKLPVDDKGDFTVESEMYIWQPSMTADFVPSKKGDKTNEIPHRIKRQSHKEAFGDRTTQYKPVEPRSGCPRSNTLLLG